MRDAEANASRVSVSTLSCDATGLPLKRVRGTFALVNNHCVVQVEPVDNDAVLVLDLDFLNQVDSTTERIGTDDRARLEERRGSHRIEAGQGTPVGIDQHVGPVPQVEKIALQCVTPRSRREHERLSAAGAQILPGDGRLDNTKTGTDRARIIHVCKRSGTYVRYIAGPQCYGALLPMR
jgi:hypothetical protein